MNTRRPMTNLDSTPPEGNRASGAGSRGDGDQITMPRPEGGGPGEPQQENDLWSGRTNWKHFSGNVVISILVAAVVLIAATILVPRAVPYLIAVLAVVALGYFLRIGWVILGTRYRITSERLFVVRGVIRQVIDQTELIRVDDVRVRKLFFDRIFGLGSVEVLSTDMSHAALVIKGIADPERVAELIRRHMRALRRKSLFIENL